MAPQEFGVGRSLINRGLPATANSGYFVVIARAVDWIGRSGNGTYQTLPLLAKETLIKSKRGPAAAKAA
jgi:hypothetical protein